MGLYKLRQTDLSIRLAAIFFLIVLGYGYVFAFFMVKTYAGLTPTKVERTYERDQVANQSGLPAESQATTSAVNLARLAPEQHQVSEELLVQDSHIHVIMYAIIAALESLIIFGLEWRPTFRHTMIVAAFAAGMLDFSGQWLMKFGAPGFAYLTITSGWVMAAVYVVVLVRTVQVLLKKNSIGVQS